MFCHSNYMYYILSTLIKTNYIKLIQRHSEMFCFKSNCYYRKRSQFQVQKGNKNMLVYIEFFNHHIQSDHGALFETVF